jgi:sensor c-di-GMP phosphodiesterase-like protein
MNKRFVTVITTLLAIAAVATPIYIAHHLARKQAEEHEASGMLIYAHDIVHRTDETTRQIENAFNWVSSQGNEPCSATELTLMSHFDLSSSYIQALGRVSGTRIICSSIGDQLNNFDLGPHDSEIPDKTRVWYNVRFPFALEHTFIAVERNGMLAIIHKSLPIDVSKDDQELGVGLISAIHHSEITSRGNINPDWVNRLDQEMEVTFIDDQYVVAVVSSRLNPVIAIAAIPVTHLASEVRAAALILVPVGVIAGLVLVFAVRHQVRISQSMPSAIRAGLKRNEFYLVYQPIVDLRSGDWVGAEALIRWIKPSGETIRPDYFIPVAEETGLIRDITARVVELVGRDAVDIFRRYPDFHIGINFSAQDIVSNESVELIEKLCRSSGAERNNIMLEITERGFSQPQAEAGVISRLRSAGAVIAIDDFGTGYSSLAHLQKVELDVLKIDKSFVDTIGIESAKSQVILHIIEMSKDLKLRMIAEGIETTEQAEYLRKRGVQYGQGWLFGKPMIYSELIACLNFSRSTRSSHS